MDAPQATSPEQRECGMCGRLLRVEPMRPGWKPIEHDGRLIWACPDCMRRLDRWGW